MGRFVVFESLVERLLFLWLEWLECTPYLEQPETFQLKLNGRTVKYTPDARAPQESGELVLYQAKPRKQAERAEFKECMMQFEPQLMAKGYEHRIFVPEDKPEEFWLNLRMLYGYAIRHSISTHRATVLEIISARTVWSLREAIAALRAQGIPLGALYTNMFYQGIEFDGLHEIHPTTEIRVVAR